jgi:hypothetical protein
VIVDGFFVELVSVELQPLNKLLDGAFRLEWEKRETKRDVSPLPWVLRESESLAQLFDNVFGLLFLRHNEHIDSSVFVLREDNTNLFDEREDIAHRVLERLFVDGVFAGRQVANDCS